MALDLGTLAATLVVNDAPLKKTLQRVPQDAKAAGKKIGDSVADGAKPGILSIQKMISDKLGRVDVQKLGRFAVAGLSAAAIGGFVKGNVDAFSELEDATAAASVVFGNSMDSIIAQSKTAATTMGMSQKQVIDAANTFGTYGKGAGLAGQSLADFSKQMTQTAGDMSSFKGGTPEEAIEAVGAALRGEMEPIRRYGVLLDDASLRNAALKLGLIKTTKEALTPQQKVLAAQAEILRQTTDAQGDFARTSESTANIKKTELAVLADSSAQLGQKLAPALTSARKVGIEFLTWAVDNQAALVPMVGTFGALALAVGGFVAAGKGIEALKSAKATVDGLKVSFDGMSRSAKIATASAGAIGIVATAVSVGYGIWAQATQEAKQQVEDMTEAIKADSGALGENSRAYAFNGLKKSGAIDAAAKLGVSAKTAVDAALGEASAVDEITAAYQRRQAEAQKTASTERDAMTAQANIGAVRDAYTLLASDITGLQGTTQQAMEDEKQFNEAVGTTSTSATSAATATGQLSDALDGTTTSATSAAGAVDTYATKLNKAYDASLNLRSDRRALRQAFDDATEAVKKNGRTLDENTQKGRDNGEALDRISQQGRAWVQSLKDQKKPQSEINAAMKESRNDFISAATAMGMGGTEAAKMASKLGLIKDPATAARDRLAALSKKAKELDGQNIKISVSASMNRSADEIVYKASGHGSMKFTARAGGGRLIPGLGYLVGELGPELLQIDKPGVMTNHRDTKRILESASQGNRAQERAPIQFEINNHYPQAEPASESTNKALQYVAALGV